MTDMKEHAEKWFNLGINEGVKIPGRFRWDRKTFEEVWREEQEKKGSNRPTSATQCPQCKRPNCFDYDPNHKKRICVWQDCNYVEGEPIKEFDDKITEPKKDAYFLSKALAEMVFKNPEQLLRKEDSSNNDWMKTKPLGPLTIPKENRCYYNPNTYCADHNCETCDFPEAKLKEKNLESQEKVQKEEN